MALVTITHQFDSIEEDHEMNVLMKASIYYRVLWDIDQKIRDTLKYESSKWTIDEFQDYLIQIREEIHESGVFFDT